YAGRGPGQLSWFQPEPTVSLELIGLLDLDRGEPVIDVGAGASTLVDELLERGYRDLTALDVSSEALQAARRRLGSQARTVRWVAADLLTWRPGRRYRFWHDRAVFHFLTDPCHQARYRAVLAEALAGDGSVVIGTFAADGPTHCSGLPAARYDPAHLAAAFGSDFTVVADRHEDHHTPAGTRQPFTWLILRRATM
ncbi:MAG: trans-aconitate 2-methyltransferase, partial [Pseudonocardiaceae bacterium]